jgi:hypothetical protein
MLENLAREDLDRFVEELREQHTVLERKPEESERLFWRWWASWIISVRLDLDSKFTMQAKEFLQRDEAGDLDPPVGMEEIRRLMRA